MTEGTAGSKGFLIYREYLNLSERAMLQQLLHHSKKLFHESLNSEFSQKLSRLRNINFAAIKVVV